MTTKSSPSPSSSSSTAATTKSTAGKSGGATATVTAAAVAAVAARVLLFYAASPKLAAACQRHVTLTSPLTSWARYLEGVFLYLRGLELYRNDVFYQSPLLLPLFALLPRALVPLLFITLDVIAALAIRRIALSLRVIEPDIHGSLTASEKAEREGTCSSGLRCRTFADTAAVTYLLNPMSIASCLALDLGVVERTLVLLATWAATSGNIVFSSLAISAAAQMGGYPLLMTPFLALIVRRANISKSKQSQSPIFPTIVSMMLSVLMWTIIYYVYYETVLGVPALDSIFALFGTIISPRSIVPNIGAHWYLMVEVFDTFRGLFVLLLQSQNIVFIVPLLLRFGQKMPVFGLFVFLGIIAINKSMPTFGDHALWLALAPLYSETWKFMRLSYIVGNAYIYTGLLFVIMYTLWGEYRTANANFFFALSLTQTAVGVALQLDTTSAMLCRMHHAAQNAAEGRAEHDPLRQSLLLYSDTLARPLSDFGAKTQRSPVSTH